MILALGWVALVLYVGAHILLILTGKRYRRIYFAVNLVAAIGFVISAGGLSSWQSLAINVFWIVTSIFGLTGRTNILPSGGGKAVLLFYGATIAVLVGIVWIAPPLLADAAGWAGAALYCVAYFLLADEDLDRRGYLAMNIAAPLLLVPVYTAQGNWPAQWMSFIWAALSFAGLVRLLVVRRSA